jgi:hypothetical protein
VECRTATAKPREIVGLIPRIWARRRRRHIVDRLAKIKMERPEERKGLLTWNETPHEKQLEIIEQMQEGTKPPLQILLDAGITPSDWWVKELAFATDLLSNQG